MKRILNQINLGLMVTLLFGVPAHAQNDSEQASKVKQKKHRHMVASRPLFNYPKEHPVYIVTFTADDLQRQQQQAAPSKRLQNAYNNRKTASHIDALDAAFPE